MDGTEDDILWEDEDDTGTGSSKDKEMSQWKKKGAIHLTTT